MKLLFTGIDHPQQISSWSGIPYHLSLSLAKLFDLCFVGELHGPSLSRHLFIERIYRRSGWPVYRVRSEPGVLKEFAARIKQTIKRERPDAILSISCEPIAYLKTDLPIYMIHDATFQLLANEYSNFQILSKRSRKTGEEAQTLGFANSTLTFAASDWARRSALKDYGLPDSKTRVIPMGANLVDPPTAEEVSTAVDERLASRTVEFLFVGVDWQRKGGDAAVSIVEASIHRGLNARLHIVGCTPPTAVAEKPFVVAHGFLSKKEPEQAVKLRELFRTASFFIVPSVAECYGCVFCEANAFGTPNISRATGGIPEIIRNGETGFLLSDDYPEERIVEQILELSKNPNRYREMAVRARSDYEARLNWDVYARQLKAIIEPGSVGSQSADSLANGHR